MFAVEGALVEQRLGDFLRRERLAAKLLQRGSVEVYVERAQLREQIPIGEQLRIRAQRPSRNLLVVG